MDRDLSDGELLFSDDKRAKRTANILLYTVVVIATCYVLFIFLFGITPVTGTSMETTIHSGQTVFMMRNGFTVERGDIIIIEYPAEDDDKNLIKRAVALSGDRLLFVKDENGKTYSLYLCKSDETKFIKLDEPYIKENMLVSHFYGREVGIGLMDYRAESEISALDMTKTPADSKQQRLKDAIEDYCFTVDPDSVFFLGDNRNYSNDSRVFGTKPLSDVSGKMLCKLEPDSAAEKFLWILFGGER